MEQGKNKISVTDNVQIAALLTGSVFLMIVFSGLTDAFEINDEINLLQTVADKSEVKIHIDSYGRSSLSGIQEKIIKNAENWHLKDHHHKIGNFFNISCDKSEES